jgi:A/G-specific adenine glycosylase
VKYSFSAKLQKWYNINKRSLPWRDTSNAYQIWLSEIILQQTRVNQGLPYYNKFAEHFPTVFDFAKSNEDDVLKLWQGLGYYSRGRNMLKCAKKVVSDYNGIFPKNLKDLKSLPGIGDYTASALLSFAYNQPYAVLDGNVYRVLSRYYGIDTPINTSQALNEFKALADMLLDTKNPGHHNQAMMEFGALQCIPKSPNCSVCIFQETCVATRSNTVNQLPKKNKAKPKRIRYFNYIIFTNKNRVLIQKRPAGDIWQGLHEFPLIEMGSTTSQTKVKDVINLKFSTDNQAIQQVFSHKHILTHQTIYADFWLVHSTSIDFNGNSDIFEVDLQELGDGFAMPVLLHKLLESPIMADICR